MSGICSLDFCEAAVSCRGLCAAHYQRQRAGQPLEPIARRVTHRAGEPCIAPECARLSEKRGYCGTHYRQVQRGEQVRPLQWDATAERICLVCGATDWEPNGYRKVCSQRCWGRFSYHGGQAPAAVAACQRCGDPIDLTVRSAKGYKKRTDSQMCGHCKRARRRPHKMSVSILAKRDGNLCGICGDAVDLDLRHPDVWRGSVDHVLPWALGGSHDPSNLQLAHLWCNLAKSAQVDFSLRVGAA